MGYAGQTEGTVSIPVNRHFGETKEISDRKETEMGDPIRKEEAEVNSSDRHK